MALEKGQTPCSKGKNKVLRGDREQDLVMGTGPDAEGKTSMGARAIESIQNDRASTSGTRSEKISFVATKDCSIRKVDIYA